MNDLNCVVLIGRLTKDCLLEKSATGKSFMHYTIAVNHDRQNSDGRYDSVPDFINSVIFDSYAENLVKYMRKGTQVAVTAKIGTRRPLSDEKAYPQIIVKTVSIQLLGNIKKDEPQPLEDKNEGFEADIF